MRFYPPKTTTSTRENSTLQKGEIVLDWDNNKLYVGTGGIGGVEVGTGITGIQLNQIPTPENNLPNTTILYSKSDGKLYYIPEGGEELPIGGGSENIDRGLINSMILAGLTI